MNKSVVITIADKKYLISQLSARVQFHLVARLRTSGGEIAQMSEADRDWTYDTCLGVVKQEIPGDRGWTPILATNGMLMFEMQVSNIYDLVQSVIAQNLSDFTLGSASANAPSSPEQAP